VGGSIPIITTSPKPCGERHWLPSQPLLPSHNGLLVLAQGQLRQLYGTRDGMRQRWAGGRFGNQN